MGGGLSILLVDDDEDDYILTRTVLVEIYQDQFQLEWVASFDTAVEQLVSGCHEVCLLDFHLGERDGLDLLRSAMARGCSKTSGARRLARVSRRPGHWWEKPTRSWLCAMRRRTASRGC